uniref:transposase family protein n=1 Tax=Paractinoplanes polyasparticus TaxID=2856853 RepID=UPI0034DB54DB
MAAAACPECGQLSERLHAYHERRLADLPIAGGAVTVQVRVRRLVCAALSCPRRTFREQVPALTQRPVCRSPMAKAGTGLSTLWAWPMQWCIRGDHQSCRACAERPSQS